MAPDSQLTERATRGTIKLRCAILAAALSLIAPAALAQPRGDDGFSGAGAAMCIAAGELLAAQPGADTSIQSTVLAWRQVLHVVEGTDEQRRAEVEALRASMNPAENARLALSTADAVWSAGCNTRDLQVRYIAKFGSEDRARSNLAEEPGTELAAEAALRVNVAASCLVAAELFSQPRPSRTLRAAFRAASPSPPDESALQAIGTRSRQDLAAAPGSAAGKELVVDYLRYLYNGASSGSTPQPFVNRTSQLLQDRCRPGTASP